MTVRFYVDKNVSYEGVTFTPVEGGNEKYLYASSEKISHIKLKPELEELTVRVTFKEAYWIKDGYNYKLGIYQGEGFDVEITCDFGTRGSGPGRVSGHYYLVEGTFKNLATLIAFEHELKYEGLHPTIPLGGVRDLSEEATLRRASLAVTNTAQIRELHGRVEQLMHQVTAQGNLLQALLTPKNV